jgi:hypothetical protein
VSAIQFRKIVKSSEFTRSCEEPGCNRMGRFALSMLGHPVWTEHPIGNRREQVQLCLNCTKEVKALWRELTGETTEDETLSALASLGGNTVDRVDSIGELRRLGYSRDAVAAAVKATAERWPLEEIVGVLGQPAPLEAVAA